MKKNIVTEGLSGTIGQLVFRQRFGKTIVSQRPVFTNKAGTDAQQKIRFTFKDAVRYAKAVGNNVELKAAYQKNAKLGQSYFNRAIADFFSLPVIEYINTDAYRGQVGDLIKTLVTVNFMLKEVLVKIETATGKVLEEGAAMLAGDGLHWLYNTKVANSALSGCLVVVTATDTPNHQIVHQKTL